MLQADHLAIEVKDKIAFIALNRPEKANALNGTIWREIRRAFEWADQTSEVRVAVLGANGKHFSAGIDFELIMTFVAEASSHTEGRKQERLRGAIAELQECFGAIERCRKPVIASIHGSCMGAGVDMIAACDMRYSTQDTRFSVKEVDLAIVADVGSLQRLPHLIGEGIVRELAFTGRDVSGEEAQGIGLVNRAFADREARDAAVLQVAQRIAEKSPLAVRGIKQILNYSRDHSVREGLDYVATWNAAMLLSEDGREAMTARLENRPPRYSD